MTCMESGGASVTGRPDAVRESSETFEELYVREFGSIVALAYALSGSRAAAEDLAQEAFLAAHRNWETVADLDAPGAWVRRVVANLSVSAFRRGVAESKAITCPSSPPTTRSSGGRFARCRVGRPRSSRSITWKTDPSPRSQRSSARPMAR